MPADPDDVQPDQGRKGDHQSVSGWSAMNSRSPQSLTGSSPKLFDESYGHRRLRGRSLRRSIFAQNAQKQGFMEDPPIEMQQTTASPPVPLKSGVTTDEETLTTITVAEPGYEDVHRSALGGASFQRWLARPSKALNVLAALWTKCITILERLSKDKALATSMDGRHVRVKSLQADYAIDERTGKPHVDNTIISCRYTPWNFLPRQLVAQFGKLANFYFLCVSILQMIPGLSTTGTYTTIVPLLIFVGISMAKEGYEDLRRHRLDKEDNFREIDVLDTTVSAAIGMRKHAAAVYPETTSTSWRTEKWRDVRVGNVVLLKRDNPVPADVILLHVAEPSISAYTETRSLDGETNLKTKKPLAEVSRLCHDLDCVADLSADFVVQDPNLDLYTFDGRLSLDGLTVPLTNDEVVYRGSILRNTPSALGLVIYSGEECKIRMNANKRPRVKAPRLQGTVNKVVILVAALVFLIAFIMTGLYQVWRRSTETKSWYLASARVPFGNILTSFIIMFNTMLPLSLYVSLEIVKVSQMFLMNDVDMYDENSNIPMHPHTSTINEELGQVSHIFSDKTGTLTNNSMKFRKISIAGTVWLHDRDIQEAMLGNVRTRLGRETCGDEGKGKIDQVHKRQDAERNSTTSAVTALSQNFQWRPATRAVNSMHCGNTDQLLQYLERKPHSVYTRKAKFFMLALALCHTCIPEKDDQGNISFQAASPDELALVTAAQELGYVVIDRQSKSITIKTHPNGRDADPVSEVYELMDVIDFSSARKRMSVVVKLPDKRLLIVTKGADSILHKLLRLADLAGTTSATVRQRTHQRQSVEGREMLRRRSTQVQTVGRESLSSVRNPGGRHASTRPSGVSMDGRLSARDSVDRWLTGRETEVDLSTSRRSTAYYTPRQSTQHSTPRPSGFYDASQSIPRSDSKQSSVRMMDSDELVDEAVPMNDTTIFERCFQHIDDFATEGLRTLLYGYRYISEQEYTEWQKLFASASMALDNRQEKMEAAGELIETNLELLGATAIEDKLQDGVPDAIDRFRRAGIKMWMLTGDKRETAMNIGQSCRLVKGYSTVVTLDHALGDLHSHMTNAIATITNDRVAHSVLIIDGQTLSIVQASSVLQALFTKIAVGAESVICCRASPSQKAYLVKTIRTQVKGSVTLAIGDGANDVAMIQEAQLGIGIAGREGLQAARTSDYSIAQFRFLLKLLLVHGRWNYARISKYVLGTFWKEVFFYLVQAVYQRWNGYTGTSLYEPWSLSMFNTLFTSLPIIALGIFEKDLAASTLLAVPELYSLGRENKGFNFRLYAWWASMGGVEAVMVYFTMYGIYGEALFTRDNRLYAMGCLAYSICVISISMKLQVIELHNKTVTAVIAIVLSVGGWWLWNLALSGFYDKYNPIYNVNHGLTERFGRNPLWWLTLVLGVMAVVLFEIMIKSIRTVIWPTDVDTFQALEHDHEVRERFEAASADLLKQQRSRDAEKASLDPEREAREQVEREAQVQELLARPRTIDGTAEGSGVRKRHAGAPEGIEHESVVAGKDGAPDEPRGSIDIAELFRKGFGTVKKGQELE